MEQRSKNAPRSVSRLIAANGLKAGRPSRAMATLAAAVVTCGFAGAAVAQTAQSMKGEASDRAQVRANTASQPATTAPKGNWTRLFTPAEREAWQQKIAAAADEQERRKLRGQRLAEIQRRTKAERAAVDNAQPATRAPRQASPEPGTTTPRAR